MAHAVKTYHQFRSFRYEGLAVKDILQWLDDEHPHVFMFMPEKRVELAKAPRQYVANVVAT